MWYRNPEILNFTSKTNCMCGRFSLTTDEQRLNEFFRLAGGEEPYVPRYNGAPTQSLAVITGDDSSRLRYFRWGLIPVWAKELPRSSPVINARAESLSEKPMFRRLIARQRCLVPADGFYEWVRAGKKQPYRFIMADNSPFAMAGLWDAWKSPQGTVLKSFAIITTEANELMKPIHDRMPVILEQEHYEAWMGETDEKLLRMLLRPLPASRMKAYRVSDRVNKVTAEGPELIKPQEEPDLFSTDF